MQAFIAVLSTASGISFVYGLSRPADSAEAINYLAAAAFGFFILAVVVSNTA